jgi:adenylosuccinate synthase
MVKENTIAVCGIQWGDEGKGKLVDAIEAKLFVGINGGSNAGHSVETNDGRKIVFHQMSAGIGYPDATVILARDKVLHPKELNYEIDQAYDFFKGKIARLKIDSNALLCLDTHRAMEQARKDRENGYGGATGRGIGPAYADVIFRNPLTMKDLKNFDEKKIREHYRLFKDQIKGMGYNLEDMMVPFMDFEEKVRVKDENEFIKNLKKEAERLSPFIEDVYNDLKTIWNDDKVKKMFELSQSVGLDKRWGIYPDVTASNTCFDGIESATYGIASYEEIKDRIGVMKATYASSVGSRKPPTLIEDKTIANMIREYGHEYGATTHRPRDIAYLDLVALGFYARVGKINKLAITHMDSVFGTPIKVCTEYRINGQVVDYQPYQDFLSKVQPVYTEMPSWSQEEIKEAKTFEEMPINAKDFVRRIEDATKIPAMYLTNGPRRDQLIKI